MKKERKLQLTLKKVSISKLQTVIGKGLVTSIDLPCAVSENCIVSVICSDPNADCKTFLTVSDSQERC
ncbi:hypothetical protein C8N46_105287 [Kordia periserrulae]|uniref:Uncharacterized protein n=1 Tax=Kordia periserrulae TaxID=701523 RepID=A0A2T6BYH1_9FLAO|nr:hypothetical protein [Kordia periserrulae]PTX61130.1 hypothetical protein C8N46_105287 [Kordia periserrulae]